MNNTPDLKEIIINEAQNIFAKFGFKKTTMHDVAMSVNRGKSTLYYYFKSKEDMFKAVVDKESLYLKSELMKVCRKEETAQKKLREYIITRMRLISKLANFYTVLKDEYFNRYAFFEEIRKKHFADEIEMIKNILLEGINKKEFVIDNLELTSEAIIMSLKGFEYNWAVENDHTYVEKCITILLEVLFYGLLKR